MRKLLILIFFLLIASPCFAINRYVDSCTNGLTTYNPATHLCTGGSNTVHDTIQHAADVVSPGDVVTVANGTYTTGTNFVVNLNRGGSSGSWITFKAENKWMAVIDGLSNTSNYCWNLGASANYVNIEDFEIKGCSVSGIWSNSGADYVNIYRNKIHDIAYRLDCNLDCCSGTCTCGNDGIDIGASDTNHVVDSCLIYNIGRQQTGCGAGPPGTPDPIQAYYNHDHGIYNRANGTIIKNNIIYNNRSGWAMKVTDDSDVQIINNTFVDHGTYTNGAIIFQGANSGIIIENNIGYNVGDRLVHQSTASVCDNDTATVRNNLTNAACTTYCGTCFTSKSGWTFAGNQINTNPLFVDSVNRNYHILLTSPAKDAGLATNAPSLDYDGNSRPSGAGYDIGMDEIVQTDTTPPTLPGNTTITPTVQSSSRIDLDWIASTDETLMGGYKVERCTGAGCSDYVQIGTNPTTQVADGSNWSDSPLAPSTTYKYRLRPYDAAGNDGSYYTAVQAATQAAPGSCSSYTVKKATATIYLTQNNCDDFSGANSLVVGGMTIKMLYDVAGLYVCASATDTQLNYSHGTRDTSLWYDDSLELMFDTAHDGGGSLDADDYKFFVNIGNIQRDEKPLPGLSWNAVWRSSAIATGTINDNNDTDTGYVLKLVIPWSNWGLSVPPRDGATWGFDISRNNTDSGIQGSQTAYCNSNGEGFDPNGWADMIFEGNDYRRLGP